MGVIAGVQAQTTAFAALDERTVMVERENVHADMPSCDLPKSDGTIRASESNPRKRKGSLIVIDGDATAGTSGVSCPGKKPRVDLVPLEAQLAISAPLPCRDNSQASGSQSQPAQLLNYSGYVRE